MWFSRCELLLEAGSWGLGEFENPEERERPPLEAEDYAKELSSKKHAARTLLAVLFLLIACWPTFLHWRWKYKFPPKRWKTY
jgi:hypothetical protein